MKALVVYSSQSGNTKKLAEAVYEVLPDEKEIHPVDEAPEPSGYDLVAVGFWFKSGDPDPKSAEYLKKISGTKLFLFATHGAAPDSDHARKGMEAAKALAKGAEIVGTFNCQGVVNPGLLEKVKARPNPPEWIGDADSAVGHPDENDLNALKEKVREILSA
ncbi:MAG: flavodoxin family protein [Deltaproteobacteria bacterium]|nr:flavodoxin family protein [Deltaproteobacteria bacterium]